MPDVGQERCGFIKDIGTRNAIFMLRILSESVIKMQKDVYLSLRLRKGLQESMPQGSLGTAQQH